MAEPYRTFASFILLKEILADELGHLYRAAEFDRSGVKRTVWLRVFDGAGVPAKDLIDRLDMAGRIGQTLHAANVASNPMYVNDKGIPAVAWDHMAAQPLNGVMRKVQEEGFPVPVDNALLILEKLALALSAALTVEVEGSSLVHGMLHPSLVLVTNDGEGMVAGFGVADQLLGLLDNPAAAEAVLPYLAPEVVITRTPSRRGDVYSLGAILFHLLTGKPLPARSEARAGVLDNAELAYDEQPVPQDIKALLERSLSVRPEERFSSAADFKKELDKLLYGGAYSPTTFNLALFMDRLFRGEIEAEERDRATEATIDVGPYFKPEPEPEEVLPEAPAARPVGKGLWIAVAAGVAVAAVAIALLLGGGRKTPVATPTPTAEEVTAAREAEEARIREAVEKELATRLAEKEKQIREELLASKGRIAQLEKELQGQPPAAGAGATDVEAAKRRQQQQKELEEARRAQQELEKQMADREKLKEQERQRLIREARERSAAAVPTAVVGVRPTAPPVVQPTSPAAAPTAVPEPTRVAAVPPPTAVPSAPDRTTTSPAVAVTENTFLDPTEVDTLPEVLREVPPVWSSQARGSRKRGVIIIQATVNSKGRVDDVKVLRADVDQFGIPQAAMDAVRKYQFKPATKAGVKVKTNASVTVPYSFRPR